MAAAASMPWRWRAPSFRWRMRSGLDTVAEGIEHDAQRDTLLKLGCKTGQGYSFGKAMPVDEVLEAAVTRRRAVCSPATSPGRVLGDGSIPATERLTPVSGGIRMT